MTNKIIIDAWNVIWKIPEIAGFIPDDLALARQRFNFLLQNYFQNKKVVYKIFYDGQPGIIQSQSEIRKQDIVYSKNPENADLKIINFLKIQKKSGQWTVITSDNELKMKVKNIGANVLLSEDFIKKLNKRNLEKSLNPEKENPKVSKDEMDYWLDIFKNDK